MFRYVTLTISHRYLWLVKGIYKITVGGRFYIGRADNLYRRITQHENHLNKAMLDFPGRSYPTYTAWAKYLYENDGIKDCKVEVIQRCISNADLYYAEQFYLNEIKGHPDCLNKVWKPNIPKGFREGKDTLWDVTWEEGFPYFFNPKKPEEKVSAFAPLTCAGKYSKKKAKEDGLLTLEIMERLNSANG